MVEMGQFVRAAAQGPVASRALSSSSKQGRTHAVFASVFYVKLGPHLIAIANQSVAPGPLTITTKTTTDWQKLGLTVGKTVVLSKDRLVVPGQITVDLAAGDL